MPTKGYICEYRQEEGAAENQQNRGYFVLPIQNIIIKYKNNKIIEESEI